MSEPDPKKGKRYKASPDEWALLRTTKLDYCRVCKSGTDLQLHHLIGRDLGGGDELHNLVPLCRTCHKLVEERKPDACSTLRENLTAQEISYVLRRKGPSYMERYYTRRSAEDVQATGGAEASS